MSEAYRGARLITTAGYTMGVTQGTFLGIVNGGTAQNIFIAGSYMFNDDTKQRFGTTFGEGITFFAAAGQLIPVQCRRILPATGTVLGVFD